MKFKILHERPGDDSLIEPLLDRCFGFDRHHKTVYRLREGVAPIGKLAFVGLALDRIRIERTHIVGSVDPVNPVYTKKVEQIHAVDGIADGDSHQPRSALETVSQGFRPGARGVAMRDIGSHAPHLKAMGRPKALGSRRSGRAGEPPEGVGKP